MARVANLAREWASMKTEFDRLAEAEMTPPALSTRLHTLWIQAGRLLAEEMGDGDRVVPDQTMVIGRIDPSELAEAYWLQAVLKLETQQPKNCRLAFAFEEYRDCLASADGIEPLLSGKFPRACAKVYAEACAILADQAGTDAATPKGRRKRKKQIAWLGEALMLLHKNPEMTDQAIAKAVGVVPSTVCRSPEYRRAREIARSGGRVRHGHVDNDDDGRRTIEAYDDD